MQLLEVSCERLRVLESDGDDGAKLERLAGEEEMFSRGIFRGDQSVEVEESELGSGELCGCGLVFVC